MRHRPRATPSLGALIVRGTRTTRPPRSIEKGARLAPTPPGRREKHSRPMKITDVRAIHLRIADPSIGTFDGSYDDCLIVIDTDVGLTGIGECESYSPAIAALVNGPSSHNH